MYISVQYGSNIERYGIPSSKSSSSDKRSCMSREKYVNPEQEERDRL